MSAIEKINGEMQKHPNDRFWEVIGTYVIDRCNNEIVTARVSAEGKTLDGAVSAVMDHARKAAVQSRAVLCHSDVFGIVDEYFEIPTDAAAQLKAMQLIAGSAGINATTAAPTETRGNIDLADFL